MGGGDGGKEMEKDRKRMSVLGVLGGVRVGVKHGLAEHVKFPIHRSCEECSSTPYLIITDIKFAMRQSARMNRIFNEKECCVISNSNKNNNLIKTFL